jgi:hypothetical protein
MDGSGSVAFHWGSPLGVSVALGELPPFQWVPAALLVPAAVLGWIGTR